MNNTLRFTFLLALILSVRLGYAQKETNKPNIIWMIAEDLSPDLGCYGNKIVKTPHINKLAQQGIMFQNAHATGSVCSPSRSAFVTGMYQTSFGANFHRTMKRNLHKLPKGTQTLFDFFHEAGYFVDYNGKKDLNFKLKSKGLKNRKWKTRKADQPVFLVFQSYHTHRPFHNDTVNPVDPTTVSIPPYYPDHPLTRRDWANYLEDIQLLDNWVGKQMKWLEEKKLLDNTIVVFFGDHGRPHVRDKQFLYDGGTRVPLIVSFYGKKKIEGQESKLISLVDLAPTMLELAGLEEEKQMHGTDIFSKKENDFIIAARDRNGDAIEKIRTLRTKDYLFIKNYKTDIPWMQVSGYKLYGYPVYTLMKVLHKQGKLTPEQALFMSETKPEFELYDLKNDPHQLNNLAAKKTKLVKKLHKKLLKWQKQTNDTFPDPDQNDLDAKLASKRKSIQNKYKTVWGFEGTPTDEQILKEWEKQILQKEADK